MDLGWLQCATVGSPVANAPLWWRMLMKGQAVGWRRGAGGSIWEI